MQSTWIKISPEVATKSFFIPTEQAENSNYHFFTEQGTVVDTFRLVVINTEQSGLLNIRFWVLDDELLDSTHNILDKKYGGLIMLSKVELKDLTTIIAEFIAQISDSTSSVEAISEIKQIPTNQFVDCRINPQLIEQGIKIYRLLSPNLPISESENDQLLRINVGKLIVISSFNLPKSSKLQEFGHYWRNNRTGLMLSKQGAKALVKLLDSFTN